MGCYPGKIGKLTIVKNWPCRRLNEVGRVSSEERELGLGLVVPAKMVTWTADYKRL